MSVPDALFEPLRGKGRTVRQALGEVALRWEAAPLTGVGARSALEESVRHLLLRGRIRGELPAGADPAAAAHAFVEALVAGRGVAAVAEVLGA